MTKNELTKIAVDFRCRAPLIFVALICICQIKRITTNIGGSAAYEKLPFFKNSMPVSEFLE
jgi:hypothetical protein